MLEGQRVMLIGYGNTLRRDDGVGPCLAEKVCADLLDDGVEALARAVPQLLPEMSLEIAQWHPDFVMFLDARRLNQDATQENAVVEFRELLSSDSQIVSNHQFSPEQILYYSNQFGYIPRRSWLVAIPGFDFGLGEGFSPQLSRLFSSGSEADVSSSMPIVPAIKSFLLTQIKAMDETCK